MLSHVMYGKQWGIRIPSNDPSCECSMMLHWYINISPPNLRAAFATISYHPSTDSYYVDYTDPWADVGKEL